MNQTKDIFVINNHQLCLVALYGNYEPFLFNGRLILRTYYSDAAKTTVDEEKTTQYFLDTIFYEANKIIRSRDQDAYDERRTLVVEECPLLGNPYYMLYNTTAFPSNKKDNTVSILSEEGKKIRGLVLIVKKVGENQFTWLEEEEARSIQNQINAIR
ncbi:MAG: hypothetical protein J6D29_04145 [Solobacterium sp.]|nr:hypothetical protein [Solobacterium sp.]